MTIKTFHDVELEVKRVDLRVERLLTDIRLILDRINHITGISGSFSASPSLITDHGILSGLGDDDHPHYLLASGTRELTGDWDAGPFSITAETLISDVAIGTAPLTVTSTTVVPNLNVDQVDGFHLDQDVTSGASPTFDGANFTGIDISDATNLAGGSGITLNDDTVDLDINSLAVATIAAGDFIPFWDITVTADNKKITFADFEATLDHGAIAGIADDDHTQYILVAGTRAFTGNQSFGDFNITDVGSISLDSIISDGTTITIGGTPNIVLTDGTTIAVTLGSDAGDDFTIDTTVFVVKGDTGRIGFGIAVPDGTAHIHTASAGSVTAPTQGDDLVVENSTSAGITILSPDLNGSNFFMGSPGLAAGATIGWVYGTAGGTQEMKVGTNSAAGQLILMSAASVEAVRIDGNGGVGIGTTTIPHGAVGSAKLAIEGADSSGSGPHVQFTTVSDDYPVLAILPWSHDNAAVMFDAYFGGGNTRSSDIGSNFEITKLSDKFRIKYDSGIAAGSAIIWNEGFTLDTSGDVELFGNLTLPNIIFVSETTNTFMAIGVTINQEGNDNQILAFKSSDVAHGMSTLTETDTYGVNKKINPTSGGLRIEGYTGASEALYLQGDGATDVTTKTTASTAYVGIAASKKSGTSHSSIGANANILVIRNHGTARWILDAEGDVFYGGSDDGTITDNYNDSELLGGFRAIMSPQDSPAHKRFAGFIRETEDILVQQGVLTARLADGGLVSDTALKGLLIDAIIQLNRKMERLEAKYGLV